MDTCGEVGLHGSPESIDVSAEDGTALSHQLAKFCRVPLGIPCVPSCTVALDLTETEDLRVREQKVAGAEAGRSASSWMQLNRVSALNKGRHMQDEG